MAEMWISTGGGKPQPTRTQIFQEVIERQAAKQAVWSRRAKPEGEAIPLQRRESSIGWQVDARERETRTTCPFVDRLDLPATGTPDVNPHFQAGPSSHDPLLYPGPSTVYPHRHHTGKLHSAWSDLVNPSISPRPPPSTSSMHHSSPRSMTRNDHDYPPPAIGTIGHTAPATQDPESIDGPAQYPWTGDDWGHPDFSSRPTPHGAAISVAEGKKKGAKGGIKGWLKSKTAGKAEKKAGEGDKGKGKGKGKETGAGGDGEPSDMVTGPETVESKAKAKAAAARRKKEAKMQAKQEKAEKSVFVGGGRGGAQNRRIASVVPAAPVKPTSPQLAPNVPGASESAPQSTLTPSSFYALSPTSSRLPAASYTSSTPFTTFTPDLVEALETLSKPKATFVGGGRGGMQNRKAKEVVLPGRASGKSGASSYSGGRSGKTGDGASSRRSIHTTISSTRDQALSAGMGRASASIHSGGSGEQRHGDKPVFVGGGRGGMQNRKVEDVTLSKKKSRIGLGDVRLLAGIGVSSFTTVVSTGTEGSVVISEGAAPGTGIVPVPDRRTQV